MVHRYRMSLDELSYIYDSAKGRMAAHPEVAKNMRQFSESKHVSKQKRGRVEFTQTSFSFVFVIAVSDACDLLWRERQGKGVKRSIRRMRSSQSRRDHKRQCTTNAINSTPNAFIAGDAMGPHQTHSNMWVSALFVV